LLPIEQNVCHRAEIAKFFAPEAQPTTFKAFEVHLDRRPALEAFEKAAEIRLFLPDF